MRDALLDTVWSGGSFASAVAALGVAALLVLYARFEVPIKVGEPASRFAQKQSSLADLLRRCALIVWNEAPMAHRHQLECLERTLRDPYDSACLFGGKVVLLGGDFRQNLPVARRGARAPVGGACLTQSLFGTGTALTLYCKHATTGAGPPRHQP